MDEFTPQGSNDTGLPLVGKLIQPEQQAPQLGQEAAVADTSTVSESPISETGNGSAGYNMQPSLTKAEVSDDDRFKFINPQRAETIIGEKILFKVPQSYLLEGVKPHDLSYQSEHQRAYGWSRGRTGSTKSGAEVVVQQFDYTTFVIKDPANRAGEPHEHRDGVEINVSYDQPDSKGRRSLTYYTPDYDRRGQQGDYIEAVSVPKNIRIMVAGAQQPLTLTEWDPVRGGRDPRFDAALRELGTLLSDQITWNPKTTEASAA